MKWNYKILLKQLMFYMIYKRDKIVSLVQEELNEQDRQLNLNKNSPVEHDRIMAKIEVLNKLQKEINEVIDMW